MSKPYKPSKVAIAKGEARMARLIASNPQLFERARMVEAGNIPIHTGEYENDFEAYKAARDFYYGRDGVKH